MRVALSRLCPGGHFSRFQAVSCWAPAAICQDCGLPPTASPSPRGCCLCPYLGCKVTAIFFNCKKNLKKYLISLKIKHLQRGYFAVKRFNRPCPCVRVALPVLRWWWHQCTHPRARTYACTQARTTTVYLLKRFVFSSRHPGGIFVLRRAQGTKIKRFNSLCQNTAHLQPEALFSI